MKPPDREGAEEDDPLIGELVDGRYQVIDLIGRGGMGRVYRAEHVAIKRKVALKVFTPVGDGFSDRQRFEREAFASGRVTHPNCVAVSDFGSLDDGSLFMVMELLDGVSLGDLMDAEGRLPPARALHIMRHILRGLDHAHESGIVHRDLKPQNVILVDHLGDPDFAKVLDFGLAKLIGSALDEEGGGKLTRAGITFGTPSYMAPEQALGKTVDHRADLYSASVILFEMLAGRPPFVCEEPRRLLMMHANASVPLFAEIAPGLDIPPDLELLLRRGLSKDADDRMSSASQYIASIERVLAGLPEPRPNPEPGVSGTAATAALKPAGGAPATPESAPEPGAPPGPGVAPVPGPTPRPPAPSGFAPLPPASRGSRAGLYVAAGLGAAVVIALIAAVVVGGDGSGSAPKPAVVAAPADAAPAEQPSADSDLAEAIERARSLAGRGRSDDAERLLKQLQDKNPESAEIAYELGNVYAERPYPPKAVEAYREAIRLDSSYRDDPELIDYLIQTLTSRSAGHAAARVLVRDIGEHAVSRLDQAIDHDPSGVIRKKAKEVKQRILADR